MNFSFESVTAAPSQFWRGIRLVPLLRSHVRDDLRLATSVRDHRDGMTFVPHGHIAEHEPDGSVRVFFGGAIGKESATGATVRLFPRLPKRRRGYRPWLLPGHVALEGMVCLRFGAPDIAWAAYSRQAVLGGVSASVDDLVSGRHVRHLDEALHVFELHDDQVGMLVFLGERLASAFVVPHPDDYRILHPSLILDLFAETLLHGLTHAPSQEWLKFFVDDDKVGDLAGLRREVERIRADWTALHHGMAAGLFGADLLGERVQRQRPFGLHQFVTELVPRHDNFLGEAIVRDDGTLEYLSSFRLSNATTRRAYLLQQLAVHGWNLDGLVATLGTTRDELMVRFAKAGFAYLFDDHVLAAAVKRAHHRRQRRPG